MKSDRPRVLQGLVRPINWTTKSVGFTMCWTLVIRPSTQIMCHFYCIFFAFAGKFLLCLNNNIWLFFIFLFQYHHDVMMMEKMEIVEDE
jgi:hypothetical protein